MLQPPVSYFTLYLMVLLILEGELGLFHYILISCFSFLNLYSSRNQEKWSKWSRSQHYPESKKCSKKIHTHTDGSTLKGRNSQSWNNLSKNEIEICFLNFFPKSHNLMKLTIRNTPEKKLIEGHPLLFLPSTPQNYWGLR